MARGGRRRKGPKRDRRSFKPVDRSEHGYPLPQLLKNHRAQIWKDPALQRQFNKLLFTDGLTKKEAILKIAEEQGWRTE